MDTRPEASIVLDALSGSFFSDTFCNVFGLYLRLEAGSDRTYFYFREFRLARLRASGDNPSGRCAQPNSAFRDLLSLRRWKMKIRPLYDRVIVKLLQDGTQRPLQLKVGDQVLFGKYAGQTVKVDGDELLVMREEDVMGVFEHEQEAKKVA